MATNTVCYENVKWIFVQFHIDHSLAVIMSARF